MSNPSTLPRASLLISHAADYLTCVPTAGDPAGRIRDGAIAIDGERIVAVGTSAEVARQVGYIPAAQLIDARGKIVAPGFSGLSHAPCFWRLARMQEYAAPHETLSPEQVQALDIPTGIIATVSMTRAAGWKRSASMPPPACVACSPQARPRWKARAATASRCPTS